MSFLQSIHAQMVHLSICVDCCLNNAHCYHQGDIHLFTMGPTYDVITRHRLWRVMENLKLMNHSQCAEWFSKWPIHSCHHYLINFFKFSLWLNIKPCLSNLVPHRHIKCNTKYIYTQWLHIIKGDYVEVIQVQEYVDYTYSKCWRVILD